MAVGFSDHQKRHVGIGDNTYATRTATISPNGLIGSMTPVRLVGTAFDGATLDPNFWTSTTANGGTVVIAGEADLSTNTTANGSATLTSVRNGRFVGGTPCEFRAIVEWYSEGDADNVRRIGCYDANNGFFFQLDGTTFSIGTRTNRSGSAVDTLVSSGSFNGDSKTYAPGTTRHNVQIQYTPMRVFFSIDGVFIHGVPMTHSNSPTTFTFPIKIENINDNDNATNNEFHVTGAAINRLVSYLTNPTYKFIGTNTTTVCKYTSGVLHALVNLDNAGTVTIYDNTAASGTQIAVIDTSKALGTLSFDAPFNNGLTIVTALGAKVTVIYE